MNPSMRGPQNTDDVEVVIRGEVRLENFCSPDELANMTDEQLRDALADAMRGEVMPDLLVDVVRHLDPVEDVIRYRTVKEEFANGS